MALTPLPGITLDGLPKEAVFLIETLAQRAQEADRLEQENRLLREMLRLERLIAGLCTVGYMLGGSQVEIKGVLGLGTAARNIGAALVPASQSFSDPKIIIMLVACTIVTLIVLFPAAAWLRRKRLPAESNG